MELADGITQEDLKLFLQEADEQIQLLDEDIIRLEKEEDNSDLMQEIFRAAHTLKGSSAMVGHQRMSELAHAMENVLDGVRKGTLPVGPQMVDALLHGLDVMRVLRQELVVPDASPTEIAGVVAELAAALKGAGPVEAKSAAPAESLPVDGEAKARLEKALSEGKKAYRIQVAFDPQTAWASVRCFQAVQQLSSVVDIISSRPSRQEIEEGKAGSPLQLLAAGRGTEEDIKKALGSVPDVEKIEISGYAAERPAAAAPKTPAAENAAVPRDDGKLSQTVRVDVDRLDTLMEQVGELVINRNQIGQIGRMLGNKYRDDELVHSLSDSLSQITKIVSSLQQDVMSIRMLPIEIVFNTLPRMVRDLARQMGKKIDFVIEGQETEVDRSVIEHLRDPLVHLLRNAVDHGVEPSSERLAAGKPETGTVRLSAYHEQDHIIIKLRDDGKGIDPAVLRQVAVQKGVLSAEVAAQMTDGEAVNLIFASGFSTAKKVTQVSGRGVGLDVVKTNIEVLNGSVMVESEAGRGTTFTLTLPLTLAIIPALLVTTGQTICAVPLSSIVETSRLEAQDVKTVHGREVIMFRGNVLPLLRLDAVFGWEAVAREGGSREAYVVVVKFGGTQIGFAVDDLLEQQELVVKTLDQFVGGSNGITGASILGDGRVVLILDVASLIRGAMVERQNGNGGSEARLSATSPVG